MFTRSIFFHFDSPNTVYNGCVRNRTGVWRRRKSNSSHQSCKDQSPPWYMRPRISFKQLPRFELGRKVWRTLMLPLHHNCIFVHIPNYQSTDTGLRYRLRRVFNENDGVWSHNIMLDRHALYQLSYVPKNLLCFSGLPPLHFWTSQHFAHN